MRALELGMNIGTLLLKDLILQILMQISIKSYKHDAKDKSHENYI